MNHQKNQTLLKKALKLALKKLEGWSNKDLAAAVGISQTAYRTNKNKEPILNNIALKLLLGELNHKVNVTGWKGTHSPLENIKLYECNEKRGAVAYNQDAFTEEQQAQLKKSGVCFVSKEEMNRLLLFV